VTDGEEVEMKLANCHVVNGLSLSLKDSH